MPVKKLIKISSEIKFKNPWWSYVIDQYILHTGKGAEYHYVHTHGSAFIVPMLGDGRFLMVSQYRYLNERESIEFPGGGIKEGEQPEEIAHKELIEETGYDGDLQKVGIFNPYNGVTDEICHVYIARNLKSSNREMKDESEEFEVLTLSREEVEQKIKSNEIYDGMTLAAWSLVQNFL
jgi:ADP-ribose pyrophosphatase